MKRAAAQYFAGGPDRERFMVGLSPQFTRLATTKDTDRVFSMLPYKSLSLSSIKDRHGAYALINKDESRDREMRRPRASIRRQFSENKQAKIPKKARPGPGKTRQCKPNYEKTTPFRWLNRLYFTC